MIKIIYPFSLYDEEEGEDLGELYGSDYNYYEEDEYYHDEEEE